MKEYERYVFWADYFNSELKRSQGRRVPMSIATRGPKVAEVGEACRRLNLQPSVQPATYPGAPGKESGYVSVKKSKPKRDLLVMIAKEIATVRAIEQRREGQQRQRKKK